jgi:hypothetical protein
MIVVAALLSSLLLLTGQYKPTMGATADPWGKGEVLNYIFFPDAELGLDQREVDNYLAWKRDTKGQSDTVCLQQDLGLSDEQMVQLRQLGLQERANIQYLELPQGWASDPKSMYGEVTARIDTSFAGIDKGTHDVLGSRYESFRQWVREWSEREKVNQQEWFNDQVRLINAASANDKSVLRGQEGRQPIPPRLPGERTAYDRAERSIAEMRITDPDPNPTDRPMVVDDAEESVADSIPESGILSVPLRQQQYSYYCGPASAQELLDYEWGYLGTDSQYSQGTLATFMQTNTDGTYVYQVTAGLNNYRKADKIPLSTWSSGYVYADETTTANSIYDYAKQAVSDENHGVVYRVNTCPSPGQSDSWGELYGLVGYYDPSNPTGNYSSLTHYVAGRGYTTYSNGRHRVTYLDTYSHAYAWGNPYGYQILDTRNMATCVNTTASSPGWMMW